jgi:hypothetical protein
VKPGKGGYNATDYNGKVMGRLGSTGARPTEGAPAAGRPPLVTFASTEAQHPRPRRRRRRRRRLPAPPEQYGLAGERRATSAARRRRAADEAYVPEAAAQNSKRHHLGCVCVCVRACEKSTEPTEGAEHRTNLCPDVPSTVRLFN